MVLVANAKRQPAVGDAAPDFRLLDDRGESISLSDLKGRAVVLYFYPRDNTPNCTTEACEFRDAFPAFEKLDAVVLGVSTDSVKRHANFKKKYTLPFTLLADVDHKVAAAYGCWGKKVLFGLRYTGVLRTTFVIGRDGRIAAVFPDVSVRGHADEVAHAVSALR